MAAVAEIINLPPIDRSPRLSGDEPSRAVSGSVYDDVNSLRTIADRVRAAARAIDCVVSITRVRFLLGAVLVFAAALKADSFLASTHSVSWHLAAALVFAEIILAGLLFSGAMPLATWWAASLCFSGFALVAGVKLWRGAADCGCFGAVATPPWVALAIDLSAIAALLFKYRECRTPRPTTTSSSLSRLPIAVGCALIAVVGTKTIVSISNMQPTPAAIDPTNWVGQRLPLLDDIDVGTELSSGAWTVIMHRHGCAKCAELLSDEKSLVEQPDSRVALVELLPLGAKTADARSANGMLLGHLYDREFNAFPVPLVLRINDGRVMFAGDQFPSSGRELATAHGSWTTPLCATLSPKELIASNVTASRNSCPAGAATDQPRARPRASYERGRRPGLVIKSIRQPCQGGTGGDGWMVRCFALSGLRSVTLSLPRAALRSYRSFALPWADLLRPHRGEKNR